jgi:hypothetical protein
MADRFPANLPYLGTTHKCELLGTKWSGHSENISLLCIFEGASEMTDIAAILACYRSGQISEAEMVDIDGK